MSIEYDIFKKYEIDFLLRKNGKTLPLEVKSGNAVAHPSLDFVSKNFNPDMEKPIVLTKGDLRETSEYLFLPLSMGMFL